MSEVKRYVTTCDCMSEASWGDYVRHADYDALATECGRLRELFKESEQHLHHWQRQAAANGRSTKAMETERDAALAELAALKGGREPFWYAVVSERAPVIDKAIRREDVAQEYAEKCSENHQDVTVVPLYTAPPAQASAWVPEGYALVPTELLDLYNFMAAAFAPTNRQQDEIAISLNLAKKAMLAATPTPGASDGKGGE